MLQALKELFITGSPGIDLTNITTKPRRRGLSAGAFRKIGIERGHTGQRLEDFVAGCLRHKELYGESSEYGMSLRNRRR